MASTALANKGLIARHSESKEGWAISMSVELFDLAGFVGVLLVVIAYLLMTRRFQSGLTAGALKG